MRHRLAVVLALLAVATPTTLAQAAVKAAPHITLAAARTSLPVRITALHLPQVDAGTTHMAMGVPGCHQPVIALDARGTAFANYRGTDGPDTVVLGVAVHVYGTPAQAAAVAKLLNRDQLTCPRTATFSTPTATVHTTETVSTTYSAGAWRGLRKLDHEILTTAAAGTQRFRVFQIWLSRGNVLLQVDARISDSPGRGALQWRWVQEAQAHILTALHD